MTKIKVDNDVLAGCKLDFPFNLLGAAEILPQPLVKPQTF